MKRKFIIVNNGLRDHRGHYFETSIAIAEAARRAGLHPILATHVDCRIELLPAWLESYPIFCTDHWMSGPPAQAPDLSDISLDLYSPGARATNTVDRRATTVRQLLARRFVSFAEPAPPSPSPPSPVAAVAWWRRWMSRGRRASRNTVWAAERAAFYFLPPWVYEGAKAVAKAAFRAAAPRALRRGHRERFVERVRQLARRARAGARPEDASLGDSTPELARGLRHPVEQPVLKRALATLRTQNLERELEHSLIFKRDLERLLAICDAGPGDHLLLGTAHARELLAIQLIGKRLGEPRMPEFHLEFRHPLFSAEPNAEELEHSANIAMQRGFLSLYEDGGASDHIRFYTDTKELSHDYGLLANLPFGTLPIPFRSELIEPPDDATGRTLRLAYLGEARDEKGFPWLQDLIEELDDDYVRTGKVRFLLQASLGTPQYNPRSAAAIEAIRKYPSQHVELFGLDAPLSPREYYALISQADAVLLPYDRNRYRACSSGTLAEAIAGGRPAVVPANSWMSSQLPPGVGETFHDYASFVGAVKRLIDNYHEYRASAEAFRSTWLSRHNPDRLISQLVARADDRSAEPRAAA